MEVESRSSLESDCRKVLTEKVNQFKKRWTALNEQLEGEKTFFFKDILANLNSLFR